MKKTLLKTLLLLITAFFITQCGVQNSTQNSNVACTPNVIDSGLRLLVTRISTNSYTMMVCDSSSTSGSFSVYGGNSAAAVTQGTMNFNAAIRLPNVKGPALAGQNIPVQFMNSDTHFAIYLDRQNGDGTVSLDAAQPLVLPHQIPN